MLGANQKQNGTDADLVSGWSQSGCICFDAVLPAFILPRENSGEPVLGIVTSFAGILCLPAV